jgi:hypothetical protein
MATWVTHFRIAEGVLAQGFVLDRGLFALGNIAPDSGDPNPTGAGFLPNKQVTHWRNEAKEFEPERFYAEALAGQHFDPQEYAFRLGYYAHIRTDYDWVHQVYRPKKKQFSRRLKAQNQHFDPHYHHDTQRLDFVYLQAHALALYTDDFCQLGEIPDYLGIFRVGAFTRRVTETLAYYAQGPRHDLTAPYHYVTMDDVDRFVTAEIDRITQTFVEKGVPRA